MNLLDLIAIAACVSAAFGGWRLGFIRRATGWIGLAVGAVAVSKLLPAIFPPPEVPTPNDLFKRLAFIIAGASIGQALGYIVGGRIRRLASIPKLRQADSIAGIALGVTGVIVLIWMSLPAMVQVPGWPADLARSSTVASQITGILGQPPKVLDGVTKSLGVGGLSSALSDINNVGDTPSAPEDQPVPAEILAVSQRSVVRLSGEACGLNQSGSGFVVAPGLIATNAHVVAGINDLSVTNDSGLEESATVRYLDTRNDIALVGAPDVNLDPLQLIEVTNSGTGSIIGYPNGGPRVVQPYTVAAVTTAESRDIYNEEIFTRSIVVLGTRIGPGDSGGPLVDVSGRVAGIAFGISPTDEETAYAIPSNLLKGVIGLASEIPISSGACRK